MSDPLVRNLVLYALSIAVGALAAGLSVLAVQLGYESIDWKPVFAAAIGPIVAGLLSTRLPRPEGAALAQQIDILKEQGVARQEMMIVPKPDLTEPS
jgi:hypothetical protein